MKREQISPDFYLDEFTRSDIAARHGIPVEIPLGSDLYRNVQRLCGDLLQPMRNALGLTIVTSGYRPLALNRLLGSKDTSRHVLALAADVIVPGVSPLVVCRWFASSKRPFDQVILEFGRWAHVGAAPDGVEPRRELLTAYRDPKTGGTVYVPGIHDPRELLA